MFRDAEMQRCRGAKVYLNCRGAEVQRCRGAELQWYRGTGEEVQRDRWRVTDVEMLRCRSAEEVQSC